VAPINLSAAILDPMLRADPVGPRITYYDDATGERIELSVLLPAHWQTAAVLFGAWWIGADVLLDGSDADIALCTADRLDDADATGAAEVAVLSMDAFGRPAPDLPIGVTDYATAVRVHGDQIAAEQRPGPALAGLSVEQVLDACQKSAAARGLTAGDRVLSTASWSTPNDLIDGLLSVLAVGASLVYVANPDPAALARKAETEKVTRR
jgi:uncharacterized protein (TIGR03089 family)